MTTIPFDQKKPVIFLQVMLKNKSETRRLLMILDTGATNCIISREVAGMLGVHQESSKERMEIITASGVESVPFITIESVSVNGSAVRNVKTIIHDLPPKSFVDGLLGLSFLKQFNVCLKFKEGVVMFN